MFFLVLKQTIWQPCSIRPLKEARKKVGALKLVML
jgi:hypothetical protein